MWSTPSYIYLVIGLVLAYTTTAGAATFSISFLIRVHGAVLKDIGPLMGVLFVTCGVLVTAPAGWLADYLAQRDERWRVWLLAIGLTSSLPVAWFWLSADSLSSAILLNAMFSGFAIFWLGPIFGLCQSLVPAHMRGKAMAILLLIGNTGGYVIGPALVGMVSDLLKPALGDGSLRYAIMSIIPMNLCAALVFLQLGRYLRKDLARVPGDALAPAA
jgi:MFS family permease